MRFLIFENPFPLLRNVSQVGEPWPVVGCPKNATFDVARDRKALNNRSEGQRKAVYRQDLRLFSKMRKLHSHF